jgi:NAD(P)-dependent dehydrogenase (short-subunit alcohol dehydrogenase family)
MEQLDGKVAVVTGAGSGIGQALALRCEREGMRVVAADIEPDALAKTAAELHRASTFVADVSRYDDVAALADHAYETYGAVDVLCNNAGVFAGGLMWERQPSDFEWTLGVNLWGILHGIRAFVPRMIAAGAEGHIVNTVSMAGIISMGFSGPYNISKFAALAATECLAHDLASVGAPIGVSAVVPSLIATRIGESGRNRPPDLAAEQSEDAKFVEQVLLDSTTQQGMQPAEVAALVVDAIRTNTFLVPTKPSYATQITARTEALIARELPLMPPID